MATEELDIVIIGGGVVGLTLAHVLQRNGISYQVLERDGSLEERGNGWGITLQWAKPELEQCISKELFEATRSLTVDPEMTKKDPESYKFLNLATLQRKYLAPAYPDRWRVRREGLRKLLAKDVKVRWKSRIRSMNFEEDQSRVAVSLHDGDSYKAKLVVGCDGSNSSTRRFLCPETGALQQLPFRFIGIVLSLSPAQAAVIHRIDPLSFQGCHPESGVYMFFCTVSTPDLNGSADSPNPYYQFQCCISWRPENDAEEAPESSAERIRKIRELCSNMAAPIKDMVNQIPEDSEAIEIKLQDWPCLDWPNFDGRITLAGDAAHAMTMYRGEAANYAITDAARLAEKILAVKNGLRSQAQAISEYETDLRERSQLGVLLSRQACVDAHDFNALRNESPLLAGRDIRPSHIKEMREIRSLA